MKKIVPITIALIILNLPSVFAQTTETTFMPQYVPQDSSETIWNVGTGFGVPYGIFGGKFSTGTSMITGDVGLGIMPFAWTPAVSVSGVIHFRDRYADVRPKITLTCSNVVGMIIHIDEFYDSLYDETFAGIGIYGGLDYRISKTSPICLDLNIGWVFPFVGNDEIKRRYDESKADLEDQGYTFTKETISIDTPKIYIGITYSPGRSYKMIYGR